MDHSILAWLLEEENPEVRLRVLKEYQKLPENDPSVVAFLTNENMTFAGTKDGKVAATTKTCHVVAYTGTTKVTPTVGTPTGMPTGMTIAVGDATDNEIPLTITIAANSTLGAAGQLNGVVNVPVTAPVDTTLQIQ